jgi:hypothetical protein
VTDDVEDLVVTLVGVGNRFGLFQRIASAVLERGQLTADESQHMKLTASSHPGSPAMANWLGAVRATARSCEEELRDALGFTAPSRGGSDGNTVTALRALPALAAAYESRFGQCPRGTSDDRQRPVIHGLVCGAYQYLPHVATSVLARLGDQGRVLLGEEESWTPIPKEQGGAQRVCPNCGLPSLRWKENSRQMRCANDQCFDAGGRRSFWSAEDMEFLARDLFLQELSQP